MDDFERKKQNNKLNIEEFAKEFDIDINAINESLGHRLMQ